MRPPIQRLESCVAILRRTAEQISVFAQDWDKETNDGCADETLPYVARVINGMAIDLDEWINTDD